MCFTAVYFLLEVNIVITHLYLHWLGKKLFLSQNVTAEYRVDLELEISYAYVCARIFECYDVRLVLIIIKCLFQMKFTIIGSNNKLLMNK